MDRLKKYYRPVAEADKKSNDYIDNYSLLENNGYTAKQIASKRLEDIKKMAEGKKQVSEVVYIKGKRTIITRNI